MNDGFLLHLKVPIFSKELTFILALFTQSVKLNANKRMISR